ncbi:GH36-type glycosyl hydrolase domain-containing protein [Undibacterium sp. Ji67W]|uniref:GH36-type glycosyl hydrolase domain-containing protein n=1 Tax=Undibacterium sp. Ji67W TaxID=3413042 RepID=UPI003BF27A97
MKTIQQYLSDGFYSLRTNWLMKRLWFRSQRQQTTTESPLRAELFSALQMEQHGRNLAIGHALSPTFHSDQLLSRLSNNEEVIINTCGLLTEVIKAGHQVTPAAAWLLDNFYLIEDQIRTAKHHLPKNYSKELPCLSTDNCAGKPRVYGIALETIAHGDGRIDPENLRHFIMAYQVISTLKLGELWAIPIMLRLALIENLRRVAARLATTQENRKLAIVWADAMITTAEKDPSNLILLVADMSRSHPPLDSSFVAELVRRLQGQAPTLTLPLNWLSQRLAEAGQTIEKLIQQESQKQAADQISISNSIGSLRLLSAMDWREFVESMSSVDIVLQQDPAQVYAYMDFATRDRYRHVIENVAKQSTLSETEVAKVALELAKKELARQIPHDRRAHIGFFLIDQGLSALEEMAHVKLSLWLKICRVTKKNALLIYTGSIVLLSLLVTTCLLLRTPGLKDQLFLLICSAIIFLLVASQYSISVINWLATLMAVPHSLPRMDFSKRIPEQCSCLVVVPTMLFSLENIDELCNAMEVRFLANQDFHLQYGLLSDFSDADQEKLASDDILLERATHNIEQLNLKYPRKDGSYFLLLHRPRIWNSQENKWMSFERKRGKLASLNAYMRDLSGTAFSLVTGDTSGLAKIKYVITLDTDTELPRDAASLFVATMAHILNRATYDSKLCRVTEGYGILQPRIAVGIPSLHASRYELLYGGDIGIDPYTRTVSDVYQDIFDEGSFIGKGIYDVDIFEQALANRMPENRILSHDLLEGCYARAGLLSDVPLIEAYPANYLTDMRRRHRWVRGDWQIASWMMKNVPSSLTGIATDPQSCNNPLSLLSRWKLFDNLRRSVTPLAQILFLFVGWFFFSAQINAGFWSWSLLGLLATPSLLSFLLQLFNKPADVLLAQHIVALLKNIKLQLTYVILHICFLPYEAWIYTDAVLRTQWRVLYSHRHLLEWNPSHLDLLSSESSFLHTLKKMWMAPILAGLLCIILISVKSSSLSASIPFLLCWLLSPALAYWISLPQIRQVKHLSAPQTAFLRLLARRTWCFFDTYVGPQDHWLPPDNVQLDPVAVIAHRTSPTNIGLSLLANVVAFEFSYICAGQLLERTRNTFQSMTALDRYKGHFHNWYDTLTLTPLQPMYVSTVDSGNLSGHLLTLRPALIDLIEQPILHPRLYQGLYDTFEVFAETLHGVISPLTSVLTEKLKQLAKTSPQCLHTTYSDINNVISLIEESRTSSLGRPVDPKVSSWSTALLNQCQHLVNEILYLAPWISDMQSLVCLAHFPQLKGIPCLKQLANLSCVHNQIMTDSLAVHQYDEDDEKNNAWTAMIVEARHRAEERIAEIHRLADMAVGFSEVQYDFLYDATTHLLSIGYNINERRCDISRYDLLASEARLACFIGIAQGQLPQESWFALGRQLTIADGEPILLSWSGSMFEYLMPLLIMPTFEHTLLDQTYHAAVKRQMEYGMQRGVPWGISESGYNAFDTNLNYQYRAFGVPGLGFKRGLGDDLVIAPYASMMALMVEPEAACDNLMKMAASGFCGDFGFFEAIDYTPSRLPRGQDHTLIHSFMSHHQGMGLLSLAYLLLDHPLQTLFESDPLLKATIPLLYERVPKATAKYANTTELADIRSSTNEETTPLRVISQANSKTPEVQLLSNGHYHVMVTSAGGSYSRWNDMAVTRWKEDSTCDDWGSFCYVRDVETGRFWSTAFQPSQVISPQYEVVFSEGRAEFRRRDNNIDLHTEIVVSPEDDIELRRTRIINRSGRRRTIEFTSYAEVVLTTPAADNAHPAFSKLFVQTEILQEQAAILCIRRPRSSTEQVPTMFHLMALHGVNADQISYETDRLQFIGRNNTSAYPDAMKHSGPLSNSAGSVLDPIVAIRYQLTLNPEQSATLDIVTGIAETREASLALIEKYQDQHLAERVVDLSWTHSQVVLRQLNISEKDAQLYARLANSVIYVNPLLRASEDILMQNHRGQSALWSYAISGDVPIVLLQISSQEHIELARQLIQAHAYWQSRGLAVDLVIWNEDHANYRQVLQDQILGLISSVIGTHALEKPGGIFVRSIDQISNEDRILFQSVARIILSDHRGSLLEQLNRRDLADIRPGNLIPIKKKQIFLPPLSEINPDKERSGQFENGIGGFSDDGREYLITNSHSFSTPAPWVNVLANPTFGSIISDSGQSYTWSENAHEFRLTPWNNDPVTDAGGETFYLRDEETGKFWSPTALPRCGSGEYQVRHGFGYSVFTHTEEAIRTELTVYVALDVSIKYAVFRVLNQSQLHRKLSVTGYVEWVLADLSGKSAMHIVTEMTANNSGICARNSYNTDFPGRTAFFGVNSSNCSVTGNRAEFIGRNGNLYDPAAMSKGYLSGKVGAAYDPCAALQVPFDLNPGQEKEFIFILGATEQRLSSPDILMRQYLNADAAARSLADIQDYWQNTLGAARVTTPDVALNVLANGWLLYQTIACRLWARSGYYQSGGAFGFRDQLQDTMALAHTAHQLAREQILVCAAHQFIEGDVQHWWHPPTQKGVRTHCSDDFLWLPLAVTRYVNNSGDFAILDVKIPFIEGRALSPDEDSYYDQPSRSSQTATLYLHCVQAIEHGLRFGQHGLPLIGSCDWNDGMDKVGNQGKGESVWLAFFLHEILTKFSVLAMKNEDSAYSKHCQDKATQIAALIDKVAWDGAWYRRAYFDDGSALGSALNAECQIDSISQSWSVLSSAGNLEHRKQAMASLYQRLVNKQKGIIQLLDPPFDKSEQNPGYIRGYVPGVRENGGQYTHAAIWAGMAFAELGEVDHAWEAFDIINPINHGNTRSNIQIYKVEPYVIAADVYGVAPHIGRGGWTWYTGSAGWMYTFMMESLLGIHRHDAQLRISPCLRLSWNGYQLDYRYCETNYHIDVEVHDDPMQASKLYIDGKLSADLHIDLVNDKQSHQLRLEFLRTSAGAIETMFDNAPKLN